MQNAFALFIVAVATGYLAWRTWNLAKRRKQSVCGGCTSCPGGDNTQAKVLPLVTIEPLDHKRPGQFPR
jgi:hypothetical protein